MEKKNVFFSSKTVELSEHKTYLELLNRVCFYDNPNYNEAELPYNDSSLDKAKTLIDMPVKAKYTINAQGLPTFRGHEAYIDEDGDMAFATEKIGTHTEVYIQEDTVEINGVSKVLPCLFAKQKIWTENKNVVAAVKRLYSEDKLYNSWELIADEYLYSNGTRKLIEYTFTGNVFLGYEFASPAFGESAKVISLSGQNKDHELLVAESLSKDLLENCSTNMLKNKITEMEEQSLSNNKEVHQDTSIMDASETQLSSETKEVSALTEWDLRDKIREACRAKLDKWCYPAFHFPIQKTVWLEVDGRESELDFVLMTYEVDENDVITVSEPVNAKLTVSVAQINDTIANHIVKEQELSDSLVQANATIQTLTTEVSTLQSYKEKFELAEVEKIEAEQAEKREELKAYALSSKLISENEISENDEIKSSIEQLDKAKINSIIAERFMQKQTEGSEKEVEISVEKDAIAGKKPEVIKASLEDDSDITPKYRRFIKNYISNN